MSALLWSFGSTGNFREVHVTVGHLSHGVEVSNLDLTFLGRGTLTVDDVVAGTAFSDEYILCYCIGGIKSTRLCVHVHT